MWFFYLATNTKKKKCACFRIYELLYTVIGNFRIYEVSDCEERLVGILQHFPNNGQINAGTERVFGDSESKLCLEDPWKQDLRKQLEVLRNWRH